VSFDNRNDISALQGFDNLNSQDNFDGSRNKQTIIVQEVDPTCETVQIQIVQYKLAILQEV
ncbi:hypothetical protein B0H11DRAFT_1659434, partial [Mycena galericulata]